jgi:hypothetical protein
MLTKSIHNSIQDCINAIFASRHSQHNTPTSTMLNNTAQSVADSDQFHTAVTRATTSTPIAAIDNTNINIVCKLYTQPVPSQHNPACPPTSQLYLLPGDICDNILNASQHNEAGVNADSIDLFINSVEAKLPNIPDHLNFIFNQIYQNNLPTSITHYFTDVYLFCLHKDPLDKTKLHPLGIPTAIRRIITSHIAHTFVRSLHATCFPSVMLLALPIVLTNLS